MGLPIFYITPEQLDVSRGTATVSGQEARHLARSLRARQGDTVWLGDGRGTMYEGRITSVATDLVAFEVRSSTFRKPEKPQVVIFQAMSKNQAMDEAVARAAESGAARFVPFTSRRSPIEALKKSQGRLARWRTIARESSKVARRPYVLEIREPLKALDGSMMETVGQCLLLWEAEPHRSFADALPDRPPRSLGIVVGPEGGFEASEADVIRSLGARTASLGELNIKAESAGSYATMLARFHYGLLVPGQVADDT
jgi:16S rRNA (uracil1498-N3)-methyltransferase